MNIGSLSEALIKASDELTAPSMQGSAAGKVYSGLRTRILSLDLLPETVLSRAALATEYGVSQSPVREAILKLEQEGLVASFPQSRTLVTKIDVEHARKSQFLRLSVELEVARMLAAAPDPALLQPTTRILRMQQMAGEDCDISEFVALDRLFHLSLFQAAGVASLWHLVSGGSGHIDRLRTLNLPDPGKMAAVLEAHERILSAIAKGDRDGVEEAMREHLSGTLNAIPAIMDAHPDYFDRRP